MTDFGQQWAATIVRPEVRRYALWELSRRAGITRDQFGAWRIDHFHDRDVVWVNRDSPQRIEFPVAQPDFWSKLICRHFEVVRNGWMRPPHPAIQAAIPDFIVPFASDVKDRQPLFRATDSATVACSLDLLTSLLLTLSRYEEAVSNHEDIHGRFPASASLAVQHGFLDRPIVDEYGFAFQQAFSYLMPGYAASVRELRVKLSHDIDEVGMPFRIRPAVGHTLIRHNPAGTLRDLASLLGAGEPSYLASVRTLCRLSLENGLDSAVYWKSCSYSDYDSGYNLLDPRVQAVVRWLRNQGIEMGAHPGYYTYRSPDKLHEQFESIRGGIGARLMGGRQHYLRWSPQTWEDWEACNVAYDSSVGYADEIGFRAGTCIPYRPWLLALNREARMLEIPLTVMDVTVAGNTSLPEQQLARIMAIVEKCRLVGGVFTLLWHNNSLMEPRYGDTYLRLIRHLAGAKRFAWENEVHSPNAAGTNGHDLHANLNGNLSCVA